jgi:hypothetical protein
VPTECNATLFDFASIEGRQVVAAFNGRTIISDAGVLLLGGGRPGNQADGMVRGADQPSCLCLHG